MVAEKKAIDVKRKVIKLDVTVREDGLIDVDSPFYTMTGLERDKYASITAPFGGLAYELELTCNDKALETLIKGEVMAQSTWKQYLVEDIPAYTNYFTNIFNLKNVKNIDSIKNSACNKTIIFVGGGPSVYKNLDELEDIIKNNRAIVIAGGSGIRLLAKKNIKPHLCLAFDPFPSEYDHVFSEIDPEYTKDLPLVCFFGLEQRCYKMWQGPKLLVGGQSGMGNYSHIDGFDHISEGGIGVSTSALHVAKYMNCERLVMLGIDLAYESTTVDGEEVLKSHADKDKEDVYQPYLVDEKITNKLWVKERSFLEAFGHRASYKTYNASDSGLPIKGYDYLPLSEISDSKAFKMHLKPITAKKKKEIDKKLAQLELEFDKIAKLGMLQALKGTLAYAAIFAPYDYLQYHRQIWTRTYDQSVIRWIARDLAETIKEARCQKTNTKK